MLVPEMWRGRKANLQRAKLQWGRDLLVPEMTLLRIVPGATAAASMGPRLVSPGNIRVGRVTGICSSGFNGAETC